MARIISQEAGEITFGVDKVKPVLKRLPTTPRKDLFQERLGRSISVLSDPESDLAGSLTRREMDTPRVHPLVETVHTAFAEHRPLILRPDDFALMVAHGFSLHVNLHAEELRSRFVSHEGRQQIIVQADRWQTEEDWSVIIQAFSSTVREVVDPDLQAALGCNFSTTTPAMRIAGEIALLDAFKRYFEYIMMCVCGIPHVTLKGTPEDWRKLLASLDYLEGYELDWWIARLRPIFAELVASSEGRPDLKFWQAICKPQEAYGGELITGWLADLTPYIVSDHTTQEANRRNPVLDESRIGWVSRGLSPSSFPTGLSVTEFTLVPPAGEPKQKWDFIGGFIGLEQSITGALQASIGWAIAKKDCVMEVIHRIANEHAAEENPAGADPFERVFMGGPAFCVAFHKHFSRATLFEDSDDPWVIGDSMDALVTTPEPDPYLAMQDGTDREERATVFARSKSGLVLAFFYSRGGFQTVKGRLEDIARPFKSNREFTVQRDLPKVLDAEVLELEFTQAVGQLLDREPSAAVVQPQ